MAQDAGGSGFVTRVCIVCEGATEVEFIKICVTPHLLEHGVYAYPTIIRAPSGRGRGGHVTVDRLANFILHEYYSADRVTTFVDFYGFKGAGGRTPEELGKAIVDKAEQDNARARNAWLTMLEEWGVP